MAGRDARSRHQPDHRLQQHAQAGAPFAERVGLAWVPLACKPFTIGLRVARRRLGCKKSEMAMVGDQIFADRMAAGLYGCPCLYLMPRTSHDKNKFVLLKRKFEPYWIDKYYQKGGTLYE